MMKLTTELMNEIMELAMFYSEEVDCIYGDQETGKARIIDLEELNRILISLTLEDN